MNNDLSLNINHLWSALTINELIGQGVKKFYIAPGMRNAPIIAAITELIKQKHNSGLSFEVIIDERAMAYRALGYSKETGFPAVIICTSGTALANFLPAIIEAKKSLVPIIILSADRPPELINSDDNQTIEQTFFFRPWVNHDLNLGAPTEDIDPRAITTSVAELYFKSLFPVAGPVHMNLSMREPLGYVDTKISEKYKNICLNLISDNTPATKYEIPQLLLNSKAIEQIIYDINNAKKGLLVIGALPNTVDKSLISNLIDKLSFSFFIEVGSSLKYSYNLNDQQIPTFDHPEVKQILKHDPPDLVVHIGGRLTSKSYYQFLTENPNVNLYVLNSTDNKEDPTHLVKKRFVIDLNSTITQLNNSIIKKNRTQYDFGIEEFTKKKIQYIDNAELSFPVISKTFIDIMPADLQILLANSTTIRTFDSYFSYDTRKNFKIFTNRGVSGIEGFIATALGISDASKKDVFLIIGDVSFIHDFNSLFMLTSNTCSSIKILLINNGGGAIFTLLPINKDKDILNVITSPHSYTFSSITKLNENILYRNANTKKDFINGLEWLLNSRAHSILEVSIDDEINSLVYEELKTIR